MADKNNSFNKEAVKKLRQQTGAGVMACLKALKETDGDFDKALGQLEYSNEKMALKKAGRETHEGIVVAYIHSNSKVGAIISLLCETDFVARTEDFQHLAWEIAMQVAAMDPADNEELLNQPYIRDPKLTIAQLIKKVIGQTGENIQLGEIKRLEI